MLSFFRRGVTAKVMLGILALGLFAIVITGFGTGGTGGLGRLSGAGGSTLAQAGSENVTAKELTNQLNRELARARTEQPELDMANFLRTGAYEGILNQLVSIKALLSFGHDAGLGVSKRLIDSEIASVPAFQNIAGRFDETTFRQVLARERITEQQLRDEIERNIIQQQLLGPVATNAQIPQGIALQYASLLLERRTGSIGLVPAQAMPQGPEPSQAEIAAFYEQQKARYTIPERRILRYARFGVEQLGNAAVPTEAEIQAYYRANSATYGPKETRSLSRVILPSQQAAQQFTAKLARGTSFAQAAAEAGFSNADTRVTDQARAQFATLTSPAAADAAFAAAEGAVTAPVQSELGWIVTKVDSINRIPAKPLALVRGEIVQALGARKKQEGLADLAARIENALADGATLDETARQFGLVVQETAPVTATGTGQNGPVQAEALPLLKTAFEMGEDEDPLVETIKEGENYAVLDVARVLAAAPAPLDQIKDRVRADFVARRAATRARDTAAAIVAKINAATSPAQAFATAGVALPPVQPVNARRMDLSRQGQTVPPPLAMLFSMKRGTAKLLEAPNGAGWFVIYLATTEAGDASQEPGLVQATRQQFSQVVGEEYAQQFARAVENAAGIKRDEGAIAALKKQLQGPGAQ